MKKGHFEAKKHAYRQTQDGVVVSFVIHPNDVPADLATAPLGTVYMIGFAAVDQSPIAQRQSTRTVQRDETDAGSTPVGEPKEKTKWQKLRPSAQAALRCDDVDFGMFAADEYPTLITKVNGDLPAFVRAFCGVHSRSVLDTDAACALRWSQLDAEFIDWRGTLRATQQAEAYAR